MLVKIIHVGDTRIVTFLGTDEDEGFQFYCQDQQHQNYCEHLTKTEFVKRLKDLNKRVQFPIDAVRQTLASKEPFEAVLSKQEADENRGKLISLKYRMEATSAPFRWEWHIKAIDKANFYRYIAFDSITKASQLSSQVSMLMQLVQKKDIELKQYRIEGAQLRRSTVATEPFNFDNYKLEHDVLLTEAASYGQLSGVFEELTHFSPLPKTTPPSVSTSSANAFSKQIRTITPRNRKRMALEKSTNHLKQKILQRQREPQLQYIDSESQEEDLDDCFVPNTKLTKKEGGDVKEEKASDEVVQSDETSIKQEQEEEKGEASNEVVQSDETRQDEQEEEGDANELKDLLAILARTSKANEAMLKEAKKKT